MTKTLLAIILATCIVLLFVSPGYSGQSELGRAEALHQQVMELYKQGRYEEAIPIAQEVLAIHEEILGPEHLKTAASLNNLAALYVYLKDYPRAEPLYKRALSIQEKVLDPEHPDTAISLNNLAVLYDSMGDYARAEPLYQRALILREKSLGHDHPNTAQSLNNLASLFATKGEYTTAHGLFIRAQKISTKLIDQVMGFTSENQKQKFLATQEGDLAGTLSLVVFHLPEDKQAVREILDVWLGRKGVILEAQRRYQEALVYSDDPEAAQVFQELAGVRSLLSRLIFGGPGKDGPEAYRKKIAGLETREKELEAKLSKLSQAFARQETVSRADSEKVSKALPSGSVLLEFAKIQPFDFKATGKESNWGPAHYLAFIFHAGSLDQIALLDLGEAEPIDRAVAELKAAVTDLEDLQGEKVSAAGKNLYNLVFAKLEKELGDVKEIYISPDGNLNLIPFEVLQGPDGKYLLEKYSFNYLASGRDLIGFGMVKGDTGRPLLMGDPEFSLNEEDKEKTTRELGLTTDRGVTVSRRSADLRGIHFTPLPGTREEILNISRILGSETEVYAGKEALEEVLATRGDSPRILHLATHGFFLTDQQIKAMTNRRSLQFEDASIPAEMRIENPLLRAGLALAGANEAVKSKDAQGSDGLLTAEEVLGLKLHGTDLVVLSACNTGTGEVKTGEGVYGLRRAFVQAGTKGLCQAPPCPGTGCQTAQVAV